MSADSAPSSQQRRLEQVLAEYLQAREAGLSPDQQELLGR